MSLVIITPGTAVDSVPNRINEAENMIVHVAVGTTSSKYKQSVSEACRREDRGVVLDYLYIFLEPRSVAQIERLDAEIALLTDQLEEAGIKPKEV